MWRISTFRRNLWGAWCINLHDNDRKQVTFASIYHKDVYKQKSKWKKIKFRLKHGLVFWKTSHTDMWKQEKSLIEIKKRSKLKESHEKRIILRPILKKYKYMVNNSINQLPGATQKAGLWVCRGSAHFFSKTHLWSPKQTETSKQTHKRHVIQSKPTAPRIEKRLRVVPLC